MQDSGQNKNERGLDYLTTEGNQVAICGKIHRMKIFSYWQSNNRQNENYFYLLQVQKKRNKCYQLNIIQKSTIL